MSSRDLAIAAAVVILVVGAVILVAITGGDDTTEPGDTTTTSTSDVTVSTPTTSVTPTTVPDDVPEAFATNLAARQPAAAARLVELSSPGSPAAAYAVHQRAALDVSGPVPVGRVEPRPGTALAVCDTIALGATCRTFDDFVVDEAGLLASFTIDGEPVADTVLAGGLADVQDTLTVRLVSAATTSDDRLVAIFEAINNGPDVVWLNGFAAVHRSDAGAETETALSAGADQVAGGSTELLAVCFDGTDLGGVAADAVGRLHRVRRDGHPGRDAVVAEDTFPSAVVCGRRSDHDGRNHGDRRFRVEPGRGPEELSLG